MTADRTFHPGIPLIILFNVLEVTSEYVEPVVELSLIGINPSELVNMLRKLKSHLYSDNNQPGFFSYTLQLTSSCS